MATVLTGKEKQLVYTKEYRQYHKAMRAQFYLEAVSIGYAIIEDRLVAFLHHAGIVSRDKSDLRITTAAYPYIRLLLKKSEKYSIRVKNLSVKSEIITALLNMSSDRAAKIDAEVEAYIQTKKRKRAIAKPGYMQDVYKQLQKIDKHTALTEIARIEGWRVNRNQLIHELMKQTAASAEETKKTCALESYSITRDIDNVLVKPFKDKNRIRRKYNIQ